MAQFPHSTLTILRRRQVQAETGYSRSTGQERLGKPRRLRWAMLIRSPSCSRLTAPTSWRCPLIVSLKPDTRMVNTLASCTRCPMPALMAVSRRISSTAGVSSEIPQSRRATPVVHPSVSGDRRPSKRKTRLWCTYSCALSRVSRGCRSAQQPSGPLQALGGVGAGGGAASLAPSASPRERCYRTCAFHRIGPSSIGNAFTRVSNPSRSLATSL